MSIAESADLEKPAQGLFAVWRGEVRAIITKGHIGYSIGHVLEEGFI